MKFALNIKMHFLLIFICISWSQVFAQVDLISALNSKITPITTLNPGADTNDLTFLNVILNDKQIVALGEATHGTKEFSLYKDRLIRNMVSKLNYKVIVIESDFTGTQALNEYVIYGNGTIRNAIEKMAVGVWSTKEFIDMVEWIRQYNSKMPDNEKVKFYGCDMQYAFGSAAFLKDGTIKLKQKLSADALKGLDFLMDWKTNKITKDNSVAINALSSELSIVSIKQDDVKKQSLYKQIVKTLLQTIDYLKAKDWFDKDIIRDKYMAENTEWVYHFESNRKTIIWAHNLHIAKDVTKENNSPMGSYLSSKFSNDYYALGFGFNSGELNAYNIRQGKVDIFSIPDVTIKNSSDYVFKQLNVPNFILDFKNASSITVIANFLNQKINSRAIGASYDEKKQAAGGDGSYQKLAKLYDGIVFIRETTAIKFIKG